MGAMNDNIYKLLIVYCFIAIEGKDASNQILASIGAIYVLPFLFLSSTAGTMADRYSKRSIIVIVKCVEFCVMGLGLVSFYLGSKLLAYSALFLLACHSAIFAPCKYGIVPEIVPRDQISKANGIVTSCTYTAIIVGTFLASFLTDISGHNFILASAAAIFFAALGIFFSQRIPRTPPSGSQKEISPRFITELLINLKLIFKQPTLLTAVCGSAFFLFVGSYAQLNMIPFALETLGMTDVQGGYLFLLTALGIGAGSLLAGKLSGKTVELGLVPFGGYGIATCCILLSVLHNYIVLEIILIALIGVFGGMYLVPLDSYIQIASPKTIRGQVIATTNFLGFFGVLMSAGMLYFLSEVIGLRADNGFLVVGIIALIYVSGISFAISGYVLRFFSMLLSKCKYKAQVQGHAHLKGHAPALFFSTLPSWPWAAILIGSQSRRMRLFVIGDTSNKLPWHERLLCRFNILNSIDSLEDLQPTTKTGKSIREAMERGTSVAVFIPQSLSDEIRPLKALWQHHIPVAFFSFKQIDPKTSNHYEAEMTQL
ncbi:MAG: MFS transporter [Chlamydiales bacterium]|nr:MFS transporter [Chlamydiales bacterium]